MTDHAQVVPKCPANGLERAAWFRRQAAHHPVGGYWHTRLMATAISIELRIEGEAGMETLKTMADLIDEAIVLRAAAGEEDLPQARAEMLAGAAALEARAMRGQHGVTTP